MSLIPVDTILPAREGPQTAEVEVPARQAGCGFLPVQHPAMGELILKKIFWPGFGQSDRPGSLCR